jgi:hypothetical protein
MEASSVKNAMPNSVGNAKSPVHVRVKLQPPKKRFCGIGGQGKSFAAAATNNDGTEVNDRYGIGRQG